MKWDKIVSIQCFENISTKQTGTKIISEYFDFENFKYKINMEEL